MTFANQFQEFKNAIESHDNDKAVGILKELKRTMIGLSSLPPLNVNTPDAESERKIAQQVLEYAVLLSVNIGDKDEFQRHVSCLRPYYSDLRRTGASEQASIVCGLNLLFLLVENRLSDFHCEIELLPLSVQAHPAVAFCTQLDRHLMLGSYDQVLVAAANPPVKHFAFFLSSLLETVRINIADCVSSAYSSLTVASASQILMFTNEADTRAFINEFYPSWVVNGSHIDLVGKKADRSEEIPSMKLINQTLSYATELERIV